MKTKTISFWITLFLFPISYYCASVAIAWVDVYYLDHWEHAFGKAGSFELMVTLGPLFAILALLGYSIGVISQRRIVLGLPSVHIIITSVAAGLLSPVLWVWGPRLNWISSAIIALALLFVVVPMLFTILFLWLSYWFARRSTSLHQYRL